MAKTGDSRIDDTMDYLRKKLTPGRVSEVERKLAQLPNKAAVGDTLSIGHSGIGSTARHAKRALMLLATLFITNPGKRARAVAHARGLSESSEAPLLAEIESWFCAPGVDGATVARHAVANIAKMPNWNNVNIDAQTAVRGVYDKSKGFNCYNAIVYWAFQAGAISKRFLWNQLEEVDGNGFFPVYSRAGWTTLITHQMGNVPGQDDTGGGAIIIPVGHTVYYKNLYKVFGHVAMSLGDGTCISQNSVADFDTAANRGDHSTEWEKMTRAVTHILPIREMVDFKFNNNGNGYSHLQKSNGVFWQPFPADER